jgi:phage shock protein A
MSIFSRLADIINSNLSAILDRAEDPEKMIRLMIQEMEDTLVEARTVAARVIADKKEGHRRLSRLAEAQAEWQRKAELALSKNRDDLAKGALIEKARMAETAQVLEEELQLLDDALAKQEEDITKLEAKLREAKAKQKTIVTRHESASSRLKVRQQLHERRMDDAFVRFEQMERRLDNIEGEVESYDLGRGKTLAEEIADLESEQAVERELEELKSRLQARRGAERS